MVEFGMAIGVNEPVRLFELLPVLNLNRHSTKEEVGV